MNEKVFINRSKPMAIIGYDCTLAGNANNSNNFWDMLVNGDIFVEDFLNKVTDLHYNFSKNKNEEDKTYSGFLGYCEDFHSQSVANTPPFFSNVQNLCLRLIDRSLQKTKYTNEWLAQHKVGLCVGNMFGDDQFSAWSWKVHRNEIISYLEQYENKDDKIREFLSNQKNALWEKENNENPICMSGVEAVAAYLKLKGPAMIVDTACSSSIYAIDEAMRLCSYYKLDACIVTGWFGPLKTSGIVGMAKMNALSEEKSSPLDEKSDGLNPAEGLVTLIIRPLVQAEREYDKIYGVITGIGTANDGRGKAIYAPNRKGQSKSIQRALEDAYLQAGEIDYIELHASGTKVGDAEEIEAIKGIFCNNQAINRKIFIGSMKAQVGHSFSAAGMAGIIKVLEGFGHDWIPPTWSVEQISESFGLGNSNLVVCQHGMKIEQNKPCRAMINAFGFGGTDSSIIIEKYSRERKFSSKHTSVIQNMGNQEIAVVGIGVMDAECGCKVEWLSHLGTGYTAKKQYPQERFGSYYSSIYSKYFDEACFIENYQLPFLKYRIPPNSAKYIDRSQQIALIVADEALTDYGMEKINGSKTSVYVAKLMNTESESNADISLRAIQYLGNLRENSPLKNLTDSEWKLLTGYVRNGIREYTEAFTEDTLAGFMDNIVAGRISNVNNFDGSSIVVDAGYYSFERALKQSVFQLLDYKSDLALVGGIHANMTPEFLLAYSRYDKKIEECVPSEGCIFFVLKRMEDAVNDRVYAKIDRSFAGLFEKDVYSHLRSKTGKRLHYMGADKAFQMLETIAGSVI